MKECIVLETREIFQSKSKEMQMPRNIDVCHAIYM